MKTPLLLCLYLLLLSQALLYGSTCESDRYMLSEVLNYDFEQRDIFSCKVIRSYRSPLGGFDNLAIVLNHYRGRAKDTIVITSRKRPILKHSVYLIVKASADHRRYWLNQCFSLSTKLSSADTSKQLRADAFERGRNLVKLIEEHLQLQERRYTGYKHFYLGDSLIASGAFKNGKADGFWTHYREWEQKVFSTIEYKDGIPHGYYKRYHREANDLFLEQESYYQAGKVISDDFIWLQRDYQYINEYDRIIQYTRIDSNNQIIHQYSFYQYDYDRAHILPLSYMHGKYINLLDSFRYDHLATGQYERGARVGQWIFYNKKGIAIDTQYYAPLPKAAPNTVVIYDDLRNIYIQGQLKNGKRSGTWTVSWENQKTSAYKYDRKGYVKKHIHYTSWGGRRTLTSYKKGKKHGKTIEYTADNRVRKIVHYADNALHGLHTTYDDRGRIEKRFCYHFGRRIR